MWKGGRYNFVIDGAHRLSAILAWIYDDYGDQRRSRDYFGEYTTKEQIQLAKKTRNSIDSEIGSFSKYEKVLRDPYNAADELRARVSNLSSYSLTAQWVRTSDPSVAETSFFKINEAATPLDNIEKRILKNRKSALAIASRSISRSGSGHRYWSQFAPMITDDIEAKSRSIYSDLYDPPLDEGPIKTADLPIAGRGYHVLPFVYDLVNIANGNVAPDSSTKVAKKREPELPDDSDGQETLRYLRQVERILSRIVGIQPRSLGLSPLVYFYNRGGEFRPTAFFGALRFVTGLVEKNKLEQFKSVRATVENFLIENKEDMIRIPHKLGSGNRSVPWIERYLWFVFDEALKSADLASISEGLSRDKAFAFLVDNKDGVERFTEKETGRTFSKAGVDNARLTHPYCNSSEN